MDLNQTAADLLAAFAEQREPEGGLAWTRALQQVQLDGSDESIERLSQLLDQVREKLRPARGSFIAQPAQMNFARLVAFYLGQYTARKASVQIDWLGRDQTLKAGLYKDSDDIFATAALAICGNGEVWTVCPMMEVIGERLFVEQPATTLRQLVDRHLASIAARELSSRSHPEESRISQEYLETFFNLGELPGGLAWKRELMALQLDYSLHSLQKLDALLAEIRTSNRLDFNDFASRRETINFVLLLGYYLSSTIARAGQMPMKWLAHEQIVEMRKGEPMNFVYSRVCRLGDFDYYPLATIGQALFAGRSENTCSGNARAMIEQNTQKFLTIRKSRVMAAAAQVKGGAAQPILGRMFSKAGKDAINPSWITAMRRAGFFAAMGMSTLQDGGSQALQVLMPTADGKVTIIDMGTFGGPDADQRAADMLLRNPEDALYLISMTDTYANLPTGRTDALHMELRTYDGNELHIQMALPYRKPKHHKGFAIHNPKIILCSASERWHQALFEAFFAGAGEYRFTSPFSSSGEFSWARYLDESI